MSTAVKTTPVVPPPSHAERKTDFTLAAAWLLAVMAILVSEHHLWIRALGWTFAAIRIWKRPAEGLLLLAFFTPLFDGFGVIPIGYSLLPLQSSPDLDMDPLSVVFFSIKPVQLISVLLIVSLTRMKKLFFKDPLDWLVMGSLLGIFAIGLVAGAYSEDPLKSFRVSCNFGLLIVLCKILMSVIDSREQFWKILHFYFAGIVFLCLVNVVNTFGQLSLFGLERTRFNNHFGFLLSMSLPIGLSLLFTAKRWAARAVYSTVLLFTFFCIVLTLSRSSLYSSIIGIGLFLALLLARSSREQRQEILKLAGAAVLLIAVPIFIYEMMMGESEATSLFKGKLISFFKMFDLSYWHHSILYDPNGGMFGVRFVQLSSVKQIFLDNWLFGEGWTNRVISFHGLYYTVLTGTGIVGFALFIYFLSWMFRTLWKVPRRDSDPATKALAIGLFCALFDWVLHCVLDTYFLQFHIWLVLAMALSYIKLILRTDALNKT